MMPFIYIKSRFTRVISWAAVWFVLAALGWFCCLYFGFIESKEIETENAYSIPVSITISNIQGTRTDGLNIDGFEIYAFMEDKDKTNAIIQLYGFENILPYVKNLRLKSVPLYYGVTYSEELSEWVSQDNTFIGITSLNAAAELDPASGNAGTVFFDGEEKDFSDSEKCYVIVPMSMLDKIERDEDGNLLPVKFSILNNPKSDIAPYEFEVDIAGYYTSTNSKAVYCSWEFFRQIAKDYFHYIAIDSASAEVLDNSKIDELREILSCYFCEIDPQGIEQDNPNIPYGQKYRNAAIIHDETFRNTVGSLRQNIETLKRLLPIIVVLVLAISAVASYFYIHVRKRELAVARSLGTKRTAVILTVTLEMLINCAAASAIAVAASLATPMCKVKPEIIAAISAAAIIGAILSCFMLTSRSGILSLKEEN